MNVKPLGQQQCTLKSIRLGSDIAGGHGESKRLNYLESEPQEVEKASLLFDWIEENYSLEDYLSRESHWNTLHHKQEIAGRFREKRVSPEILTDLHWMLYFRSQSQTRIDAAFDLMRQMPLESLPEDFLHIPFRRAGMKRITFAEWMRERDMPLPPNEPVGSDENTVELTIVLSSLETCTLLPSKIPKGAALLYGDENSKDPQTPHFKGVLKMPDDKLYWALAYLRENKSGRLLLEIQLKPKQ